MTSGDSQGDSQNAENSRGRPAADGIGRRCAGGRADASGAAGGRDRAEKEICVKAENRMIERGLQKLRFLYREYRLENKNALWYTEMDKVWSIKRGF